MGGPPAVPPPKQEVGRPQERRCDLCGKLGLGGDAHHREWCFIDPKSRVYKPEVRRRKVARARALGLPIPPEIDIDDDVGGSNLLEKVEQLVGFLVESEDERQQLVDEFIEGKQFEEGGLLATITHLDDGDLP